MNSDTIHEIVGFLKAQGIPVYNMFVNAPGYDEIWAEVGVFSIALYFRANKAVILRNRDELKRLISPYMILGMTPREALKTALLVEAL